MRGLAASWSAQSHSLPVTDPAVAVNTTHLVGLVASRPELVLDHVPVTLETVLLEDSLVAFNDQYRLVEVLEREGLIALVNLASVLR